ncbi:MAG TPA: hypothetical protein PK011_12435, partial [Marinagarivorans sp.]|nr:hypothetical protein [Marinagarivorans sp.]
YFWANRLLPLDLSSRGDWEVHSLFIVWLLALLYPLIRPIPRAWIEQFWLAGVGFLLLPLINAATTERHFFNSIIKGDSVFLAIDIAALITGLLFISGAVTLTRRQKTQLAVQDRPARSTKTLNTLSSAEAT